MKGATMTGADRTTGKPHARGSLPKATGAKRKAKPPAQLVPYKRPNTELERLKAMSRFRGISNWLASLPPAERKYERRRFLSEVNKTNPRVDVTDSDLTRALLSVGTEWVRQFYPDADHATFMVWRPFGADKKLRGDHVTLTIDHKHHPDQPVVAAAPARVVTTVVTASAADEATTVLASYESVADTLREWLVVARGALSLIHQEAVDLRAEYKRGGPLADLLDDSQLLDLVNRLEDAESALTVIVPPPEDVPLGDVASPAGQARRWRKDREAV